MIARPKSICGPAELPALPATMTEASAADELMIMERVAIKLTRLPEICETGSFQKAKSFSRSEKTFVNL
eukprot:6211171-Pleurochrysis_carterae.AAC.1